MSRNPLPACILAMAISVGGASTVVASPSAGLDGPFQVAEEWLTLAQLKAKAQKMGFALLPVTVSFKTTKDGEYRVLRFGKDEMWVPTTEKQFGTGIPGPGNEYTPVDGYDWSDASGHVGYRFAGYTKDRKKLCLITEGGTLKIPYMMIFDKKYRPSEFGNFHWVKRDT